MDALAKGTAIHEACAKAFSHLKPDDVMSWDFKIRFSYGSDPTPPVPTRIPKMPSYEVELDTALALSARKLADYIAGCGSPRLIVALAKARDEALVQQRAVARLKFLRDFCAEDPDEFDPAGEHKARTEAFLGALPGASTPAGQMPKEPSVTADPLPATGDLEAPMQDPTAAPEAPPTTTTEKPKKTPKAKPKAKVEKPAEAAKPAKAEKPAKAAKAPAKTKTPEKPAKAQRRDAQGRPVGQKVCPRCHDSKDIAKHFGYRGKIAQSYCRDCRTDHGRHMVELEKAGKKEEAKAAVKATTSKAAKASKSKGSKGKGAQAPKPAKTSKGKRTAK